MLVVSTDLIQGRRQQAVVLRPGPRAHPRRGDVAEDGKAIRICRERHISRPWPRLVRTDGGSRAEEPRAGSGWERR